MANKNVIFFNILKKKNNYDLSQSVVIKYNLIKLLE